jgi:hypothetical protein
MCFMTIRSWISQYIGRDPLIYKEGVVLSQLKACPIGNLSFPTAKNRLNPSWKLTNQT